MAIKATRQPIFGGIEDAPTAATTEYASFYGGNSSNTWAATESWRRAEFPVAGNIINFKVKINTAPGAGKSVTFTVMKNGSAQAMAVTIADANTEGEYVGSISIADGDRISIRCTQTNTPTLFTVASWSTMFEPTPTKRCVIIGGTGNGTGDVASGTTEYQPASGGYTWSTDITLRRTLVAIDGTIRSWNYRLSSTVPAGTTLAVSIYKNGSIEASSTLTFTGGGGQSAQGVGGLSIDIAPGDTLSIGVTTTGTTLASAIFGWWGLEIEPDTDGHSQISGMDNSPSTTLTEYFFATNQSNIGSDTVEADRTGQAGVREIFTLSHLRGLLSTAPGAGKNRTLNVRKNSAAGNSSAVIADANTAGVDSSNSDSFSNGDVISIQMVPTGTPASTTAMLWAARITMNWSDTELSKGLIYRVSREHAAITKGLTYSLPVTEVAVTKGLIYRVHREVSAITKGARYVLKGEIPWLDNAWAYRVPISSQHVKIAADLTDYPAYIPLSLLPAGFHSHVKSDGADIRVTAADGETELPCEIVNYDPATDTGELHFKCDIDGDVFTTFFIYYGNASASLPAENDTYGAENVWEGYRAVYHLQEDGNTNAGGYKDSSGNDRDATGVSMTASSDVDGKLEGKAQTLDGAADYIEMPDGTMSMAGATTPRSVQAWAKFNNASDKDNPVISGRDVGGNAIFTLGTGYDGADNNDTGYAALIVRDGGGAGLTHIHDNADITNGVWRMLHATRSAAKALKIFVNGVEEASGTDTMSAGLTTTQDAIGAELNWIAAAYGLPSERYMHGDVDEVRIYDGTLSPQWIETEYNNHNDPATFWFVGAEEANLVEVAVTKGLAYSVHREIGITKALAYEVLSEAAITKGLIYRVTREIAAIEKGLDYEVVVRTALTKDLEYIVLSIHALTKGLIYRVLHDIAAITKGLAYEVLTETGIQKDLEYQIHREVALTKGLAYEVMSQVAITKDLEYQVLSEAPAITKGLVYRVLHEIAAITKALQYEIRVALTISKDLAYEILTENAISKALSYEVRSEVAIQKALTYEVLSEQTLQKGLAYFVLTADHTVKVMTYRVHIDGITIQKTLTYEVLSEQGITKALQYRVAIVGAMQKGLAYEIRSEHPITKALTYALIPYPYTKKTSPWTRKNSPYARKVDAPFSKKQGPYTRTAGPYRRRAH